MSNTSSETSGPRSDLTGPRLLALLGLVAALLWSLSLWPAAPAPPAQTSRDPLSEGLSHLSQADPAGAIPALRQAVSEDPQDPAAHYMLGVALAQTEPDQASAEAATVQALAPHTALAPAAAVAVAETKATPVPTAAAPPPTPVPSPLMSASPAPTPAVASTPAPTPAVASTPTPKPAPVPKATPRPVASAAPSPSASPDDAVEYNFPSTPAAPSPPPAPPAGPPAVPAGRVVLSGTVTRPDERGDVVPLQGKEVVLLALGESVTERTLTDGEGRFAFRPVPPRYDYYVVVVSPLVTTQSIAPIYQQVPGPNGTIVQLPIAQHAEVHHDLSWHQALDLSKPGRYELTLDKTNADPTFAPETRPTWQSISGTAFSSYRIGYPTYSKD